VPVTITLQYFDGCPNWQLADRDLKEAIRRLDLDADISYQKVESHDEAQRLQFRGSPTILVAGRDPFADSAAPVGLSCRVYRTGRRSSGTPGLHALQRVLGSGGT
jgi:hypothetical protein